MRIDKSLVAGSTILLLLKLLEDEDMYGYQMIEALSRRSDDTFTLKAGTLYPLLRTLEQQGYLSCYEQPTPENRTRKYYHLTRAGKAQLTARQAEWQLFCGAVTKVLKGGKAYVQLG